MPTTGVSMRWLLGCVVLLAACAGDETCPPWFADQDGDGHGAGEANDACDPPEFSSPAGDDCDDLRSTVYPGAPETCDSVDQDCDGTIDEEASDALSLYVDADGDGYGGENTEACTLGTGLALQGGDCDDTNAERHPDALELCSGIDEDCDDLIDDDDSSVVIASDLREDLDGDGFGTSDFATSCALSAPNEDDCDDTDAARNPGAAEVCDGADNDCDTLVDDDDLDVDTSSAPFWFLDADDDGFGDASATLQACEAPLGHVATGDDCNDDDDAVSPIADEVCNAGVDDDCDTLVDDADDSLDAGTAFTMYTDLDEDGYGVVGLSFLSCTLIDGAAILHGDCDDADVDVNPAADEVPYNLVDDDCDATTPDDDLDGDGFLLAEDCDDNDDDISPSATETCNLIDDDCDDQVDADDDGLVGPVVYLDEDGDDFGLDASAAVGCVDADHASEGGDCNDEDPSVWPGAPDLPYDGVDRDCDPLTLEDDLDGDGFLLAGDCDDLDEDIRPDAAEQCDEIDNDCDDLVDADDPDLTQTAWLDADLDGYGDPSGEVIGCVGDGLADNGLDCDDADADVLDGYFWAPDIDGDGLTNEVVTFACEAPADHLPATTPADCDDLDDAVYPGALEVCEDTLDQNCDGVDAVCHVADDFVELADAELVIYSSDANGAAGASVVNGGDLDGDGLDDLVVGVPKDDQPGTDGGIARVFADPVVGVKKFSSSTGKLLGESANDQAGAGVLGVGDIDGDGNDDLLVGAEFAGIVTTNDGAIYVWSGNVTDDVELNDASATWHGDDSGDEIGEFMAALGDVDDDGLVDLLVGAPKALTGAGEGAAYVVTTLADDGTHDVDDGRVEMNGDGDLGHGLSDASDLDGDGLSEFLVGAPFLTVGGVTNTGAAYVWSSSVSGVVETDDAGWSATGTDGSEFGWSGASGDFDGDGHVELVIGAKSAPWDGVEPGGAFVFEAPDALDGTEIDATSAIASIYGEDDLDHFGAVLAVGDHDGDGTVDLAVSAKQWGASNDGRVYLYMTLPSGDFDADDADRIAVGDNADSAGDALAFYDHDNDGRDDLVVGAPNCDRDATDAGCVYILFGID